MLHHGYDAPREALDNIQAHLLRASKFESGQSRATRNWSLFFFFRIVPQAEIEATEDHIKQASTGDAAKKRMLWADFAQPSLLNAGLADQFLDRSPRAFLNSLREPGGPAQAFLAWLKIIASADGRELRSTAKLLLAELDAVSAAESDPCHEVAPSPADSRQLSVADLLGWIAGAYGTQRIETGTLKQLLYALSDPDRYLQLLRSIGEGMANFAQVSSLGPLPVVALYELLRQGAPAMANNTGAAAPGVLRSEARSMASHVQGDLDDVTPINIAFTYSGLGALKLNETTLTSFPDAYRQGMAARAERLRDTGPSAPEHWEGELGQRSVHGYFTGGARCIAADQEFDESFWKAMRSDVAAFNDPLDAHGDALRFWLRLLFRGVGLEVLHIELGQDPYRVEDGRVMKLEHRVEHFGFRDGLSQPFVDLGLGDTLPGGGKPSRGHTWMPVAPGEIFLNIPDEDGKIQLLPICKKLTLGATFLVFRKLQQDVAGFRSYLDQQRPKDPAAQKALAAQFMGRWPNGMPLVTSPEAETNVDDRAETLLNDFRYVADDPRGEKCPLGAHIRRANPRDIGGRNEVRHHRILRRSMSYGGPLLPEGVRSDGEERGLLFIAVNSRIDLQFEVVQADWINGGEFLGQAGLRRCPILGANDEGVGDSFLEAGAVAPVTGLPRFVITRGGDYFFAPGIDAIRLIAEGERFEPQQDEYPFGCFSMGDTSTPSLVDPERLRQYGKDILLGVVTDVRVKLPAAGDQHDTVAFVGRHADVQRVLRDSTNAAGELEFSVRHYRQTGQHITRGHDLIVGTDQFGPNAAMRSRLHHILNAGWLTLKTSLEENTGEPIDRTLRAIVQAPLDAALRRMAHVRRIDLFNDFAIQASYAVLTNLYGTPGPRWFTELAASLQFARQHVGDIPPDWISASMGEKPDNPGLVTMLTWSALIGMYLLGNLQSQQGALLALSRQAGSELLDHLDGILSDVRAGPRRPPRTLVDAFVRNETKPEISALYGNDVEWTQSYYRDVAVILLEITGTTLISIPLTFVSVMGSLLKFRVDLANLMNVLNRRLAPREPSGLERLIYEAERLNPSSSIRMRFCEATTLLPSGATVKRGDWVTALIAAANLDPRAFPDPLRFSLDPYIPGPVRNFENYLLFGEKGTERACWGRDRVAMVVLEQSLITAGRLRGLRRIAGPRGEDVKLGGVTIGLPARFTKVV
jgi:Dyp-type peroxidase family